jgi:hypothetical protein
MKQHRELSGPGLLQIRMEARHPHKGSESSGPPLHYRRDNRSSSANHYRGLYRTLGEAPF